MKEKRDQNQCKKFSSILASLFIFLREERKERDRERGGLCVCYIGRGKEICVRPGRGDGAMEFF